MKEVETVPAPRFGPAPDPWLDKLMNGKRWELGPKDWDVTRGGRYATRKSAENAFRAAARARGVAVAVEGRQDRIYVQALDMPRHVGKGDGRAERETDADATVARR